MDSTVSFTPHLLPKPTPRGISLVYLRGITLGHVELAPSASQLIKLKNVRRKNPAVFHSQDEPPGDVDIGELRWLTQGMHDQKALPLRMTAVSRVERGQAFHGPILPPGQNLSTR